MLQLTKKKSPVENGKLQKANECSLNVSGMLNILHSKLKYNI